MFWQSSAGTPEPECADIENPGAAKHRFSIFMLSFRIFVNRLFLEFGRPLESKSLAERWGAKPIFGGAPEEGCVDAPNGPVKRKGSGGGPRKGSDGASTVQEPRRGPRRPRRSLTSQGAPGWGCLPPPLTLSLHGKPDVCSRQSPTASASRVTPGFLIQDFLTERKSSICEVWAAPGGRETFRKGGGLCFPTFLEGFRAARGRPDPPKSTISLVGQKNMY